MRLRKNLKRTAAAAMALGMAVTTAAPAATAAYYVKAENNSSVTIEKDESGNITVTKDGKKVDKEGDSDDVIIYGDEKPDYSNKSTGSSDNAPADDSAADAVAPPPAKDDTLPVETAEKTPAGTAEEVTEETSGETTETPQEDTGSTDEAPAPEQPKSETETEEKPEGDAETPTAADGEGEQAGTAPTEDGEGHPGSRGRRSNAPA